MKYLDPVKNFCQVEVKEKYDNLATEIELVIGEGLKLPPLNVGQGINMTWCNLTDYANAIDDPNREIIRITAINGDILTIQRGQENTTAKNHNLFGKKYYLILTLTAKTIEDIDNNFEINFGGNYTKTEVDNLLLNKSDITHNHNSLYSVINHNHDSVYAGISHTHTISNITGLSDVLSNKSDVGHNHNDIYYTETEINNLLSNKADTTHNHDSLYYQKSEIDNSLSLKADLVAGKIPSSQLPAFVDDVLEFNTLNDFPATGETGKLYIAIDTGKTYRWSGSQYTVISDTITLGETSQTAFRGDYGIQAYNHISDTNNPHNVSKSQIGLANVDNTSDLNKPISTTTQTALDLKEDLSNKAIIITGNETSNTKYATIKAMYDWATELFATISALNTTNTNVSNNTSAISGLSSSKENTITAGTTSQYFRGDKTWQTLDKTAVGLSNVDNTSDATKNSATVNLTNKNIVRRVNSQTSTATLTPVYATYDDYQITALAVNLTIANPTGTPNNGEHFIIRLKDNGVARTITFGANYRAIGITLPTTTVVNKTMYIGCKYNSTDTKIDVIALSQEA